MTSIAFLVLRLAVGGLLAGHGAQKLFGFDSGPGLEGTQKMMGRLGIRPADRWALLAGTSEFLGGVLTTIGLLNPLGPIMAMGSMATASMTAHKDKPIWGTAGGAELPVTNLAALAALVLAGPGKLSLDAIFRTKVPWWFSFLALAGVGYGVAIAAPPAPIALPAPDPQQSATPGVAAREAMQSEQSVEATA
ncbi:MAG TPA: DoxX family protein [Candidatus Limnocylindrales bacterium]|nr:DoxX family protein [Candidatus Limnocylindrales bacterium]